jgi:hypothetical protein
MPRPRRRRLAQVDQAVDRSADYHHKLTAAPPRGIDHHLCPLATNLGVKPAPDPPERPDSAHESGLNEPIWYRIPDSR